MMFRTILVTLFAVTAYAGADQDWAALEQLKGKWVGAGHGSPGIGKGSFTFLPAMNGKIYVRKNRAAYPATKARAAFVHEDYMTVYREGDVVRADYVDNEGHVIRYVVTATNLGIDFISVAVENSPRYRLHFAASGTSRMKLSFDIAPPGKNDQFTNYIEAELRRK